MARAAKITLSDKELSIASDEGWILTKWEVMDTVYDLLGTCVEPIRKRCAALQSIPSEAWQRPPKISRGENYRRLPYAILDFPRLFSGDDIFAMRTMFWWAHFFSVTLHVSGKYLPLISDRILDEKAGPVNDIFFCIQEDPWQHHFEENNYRQFADVDRQTLIRQIKSHGFVKLALKYDLKQWNQMPALLEEGIGRLASFLD